MSYQDLMYNFFDDFDVSLDIYGQEDVKGIEKVKTLISNKTLVISNIRKNVNAVITLATNGMSGTYVGFRVEIVHKDNGEINSKWFGFADYMPKNCQVGDMRTKGYFGIVESCGQNWYGSAPNDTEKGMMVKAIMKYIGTWT